MANRVVSVDGLKVYEIRIALSGTNQLTAQVSYNLLSGGQILTTGTTIPSTLPAADTNTISAAYNAVVAAVTREQLG